MRRLGKGSILIHTKNIQLNSKGKPSIFLSLNDAFWLCSFTVDTRHFEMSVPPHGVQSFFVYCFTEVWIWVCVRLAPPAILDLWPVSHLCDKGSAYAPCCHVSVYAWCGYQRLPFSFSWGKQTINHRWLDSVDDIWYKKTKNPISEENIEVNKKQWNVKAQTWAVLLYSIR